MDDASIDITVQGWFEYHRLAAGTRPERKSLELGEPADAVAAHERVDQIISEATPEDAMALIAAMLHAADDEQTLIAVAAGPFEDLLAERWSEISTLVDERARVDARTRRALQSMYLTDAPRATLQKYLR